MMLQNLKVKRTKIRIEIHIREEENLQIMLIIPSLLQGTANPEDIKATKTKALPRSIKRIHTNNN
jgi:hypothetical protein